NRRTNHIWGAVDLYKLDGEAVYCVNPWVEAVNGTTYENSDFYKWYGDNNSVDYIRKGDNENAEKLIYTESMIETLALIAFFGYDYPGHQTNEYYAAAQKIIWENITGKEVVIYKMNETANQENGCWAEGCYGSQVADLSNEMNEIYTLIENYRKHISYTYTYQKSEDHSVGSVVDVNDVKVGDVIKVTVSGADLKYYRIQNDKLVNMAFCDADGTIWNDAKLNSMNSDSAMASLNNVFYVTPMSTGTAQFGLASRELAYFTGQKPFLFKGIGDTRTQEMLRKGDVRNPDGKDGVFTAKAMPKINLTIEKKDPTGKFIPGAKIAVYDGTTQVYSCTSGTSIIRELDIKILKPGKTYTVREIEVPAGYVKAKDTSFSIPSEITDNYTVTVKMTDGQVFATKIDQDGKALSGASMQVLLGITVIDSWITDGKAHAVNGLEEGKTYTLHEAKAPEGYLLAEDQTFTATSGTITVTATDRQITAQKKNPSGGFVSGARMQVLQGTKVIDEWTSDGKSHPIIGLEKGKEYILREVEAPKGYVKAKDVLFTITDNLKEVAMTDGQVKAKKVDAAGKAVSGVKLQVLQGSKVIDSWTTDGTDHVIENLVEGTSYLLHEAEAPAGYAFAEDVPFIATSGTQTLTMSDLTVSVTKTDDQDQPLKGAVLQILEGTEIVAEWTTNGSVYRPTGLKAGVEYTLHEASAPNGYDLADDQKFTITDKNVVLKAVDKRKQLKVTAIKTDTYDTNVRLSGAEFTIYNKKDDTVAKLTNGKDAVLKTDENGTAEFSLYYDSANYYMKETGAPEGYTIDEPDKKYDITADGVFEFTFTVGDTSKAEISMVKVDAETGERTQGDAKFVGAEYEVTDTKLNKVVGTFTLGEDGKSTAPIKGIALDGRTYVLKETKAPEGYQLSNETVEFIPTQKEYVLTVTHKDSVKKNHIRVMKVYDNSDKAAQVQPEKDAEFTIILKSFVEKYESFEEAYEALKADNTLLLESEWDSGTTSETGEWTSRDLAYGKYILKQTASPDEEVMIAAEEIEVNITGDETSD
ncbi:MAG: hypothetical protein K6F23_11805, partial [Solobacterium sp.]|nr:hypothetical protein [Solobacterium sp.]